MTEAESEKKLERLLITLVKANGGLTFKFLPFLVAGIPDRICLMPGGRIFFAEIKTTGQKAKPLQLMWQIKLRKLGFKSEIVETSKQIKNLVKEYE